MKTEFENCLNRLCEENEDRFIRALCAVKDNLKIVENKGNTKIIHYKILEDLKYAIILSLNANIHKALLKNSEAYDNIESDYLDVWDEIENTAFVDPVFKRLSNMQDSDFSVSVQTLLCALSDAIDKSKAYNEMVDNITKNHIAMKYGDGSFDVKPKGHWAEMYNQDEDGTYCVQLGLKNKQQKETK